jgi:hypothetical protein
VLGCGSPPPRGLSGGGSSRRRPSLKELSPPGEYGLHELGLLIREDARATPERCGEAGENFGVDPVGLGEAPDGLGEVPLLKRIDHGHGDPRGGPRRGGMLLADGGQSLYDVLVHMWHLLVNYLSPPAQRRVSGLQYGCGKSLHETRRPEISCCVLPANTPVFKRARQDSNLRPAD